MFNSILYLKAKNMLEMTEDGVESQQQCNYIAKYLRFTAELPHAFFTCVKVLVTRQNEAILCLTVCLETCFIKKRFFSW